MAETATRPTRARASRAAAAKAAPAKAAPKTAVAAAVEDATKVVDGNVERLVIELEYQGDTKSYAVFTPPAGSGCVGKFYAPLGTAQVRVALKGSTE